MKKISQIPEKISSDEILFLLAGIAHDYNNIATIICGNISIAKSHTEQDSIAYEYLTASEQGVKQAKELSRLLLNYTKESLEREPVNLLSVIDDTTGFLLRNSQVKVKYDAPEEEIMIKGVEIEIKQVVRNLILNAKQAMSDGGTIRISAKEIYLPDNNQFLLSEGKYAVLTFENNGRGIPQENISRIFEPHYTSRIDGHGLGLAICLSIIKKHKGHIQVSSENEKGVKFEIFLPINLDREEEKLN